MIINIVPATSAHIRELSNTLRDADRREMEAFGFPSCKALWRSYKGSFLRKTALVDGEVAAIWGVGGVPMGLEGNPWLMTSVACERVSPLRFARIYQQQVQEMLRIFPRLVNWVDSEYDKAMRLLDIIGFTLHAPEPLGKYGHKYCKFEMGA